MRKFFSCLTTLVFLFLVSAFFWSQRGAFLDFLSTAQRQATVPAPVSYEEVAGGQENQVKETVENPSFESDQNPLADQTEERVENNESQIDSSLSELENEQTTSSSSPSLNSSTPSEYNLAVPFTSQAPSGNWDIVHEETCEEAALYMVHEFYQGISAGQIAASTAEADIMQIVEFEKALFGFFESTTATQIAVLAEQMYGYEKVEVVSDPTIEDLKSQLLAGHPVIVPTAGRLLGNPNFTGEGPLYHALVLKGYTETTFITNDPGTRRGADYQYDFATVMEAMHDWNEGDVLNGARVVVVVYPNE